MSLGIIGPIGILTLLITYATITLSSIYFVVKNEKSLFLFIWLLFILFIPFIGGGIYLIKHFANRNSAHNIA